MFNAFKYTKQLEEAGFSREQAEIQLQVISEIVEGELATKQDVKTLSEEMKAIETRLINANQVLEYRIIIKIGTLFVIGFTAMASVIKFWLLH